MGRWCPKECKKIAVNCPQIIKSYNRGMGGVDLADLLISHYRIIVKTNRWYIQLFWDCIDICKVSARILYDRHCSEKGIPSRKRISLLQFSLEVADSLINENKSIPFEGNCGKVGKPRKRMSRETDSDDHPGKKHVTPSPIDALRSDKYGHWPIFKDSQKGRCHHSNVDFPGCSVLNVVYACA